MRVARRAAMASFARTFDLARAGWHLGRAAHARDPIAAAASRRAAATRLTSLQGIPQKIGQAFALAALGDNENPFDSCLRPEPVDAQHAFRWIDAELSMSRERVFQRLERRGIAASLGQVHEGILADGRHVAVKIQYPGIHETIDGDLALLSRTAGVARGALFDARRWRGEMARILACELDYKKEAAALRRFQSRAREVDGLDVPEPIDELCTERLLVMSWIEGRELRNARGYPAEERLRLGRTLLRIFLLGWTRWHELHADPHPGNLKLLQCRGFLRLGLVDFGSTLLLKPEIAEALLTLVREETASPSALLERYVRAGFREDLLAPIRARLPAMTELLARPFRSRGAFDVDSWSLGTEFRKILGDDRWNFRLAGPPELLLFVRAFHATVRQLSLLGARVDWGRELDEITGSSIAPARTAAGEENLVPTPSAGHVLRIRVVEAGDVRAQLSFPAHAVAVLPDLMPDDVRERIENRKIDLVSLTRTAVEEGCQPGEIFRLEDGNRSVRVWIEAAEGT